jgi:CubicO group peptidase (beta-lactamase class C family)
LKIAALGEVLKRRIFDPVGMKDTSFLVPREKRARRAAAYGFDEEGRLTKRVSRSGVFVSERPDDMTYESGGAGLWSTIDDYLKFARLFVGDGQVEGVRLLRPETLAMMVTNQLTASQPANPRWLGLNATGRGLWPGCLSGAEAVMVFLAHNMVDFAQMSKGIGLAVWGAIDTFQTLASVSRTLV